ncbi:MAG: O-antigen ligase family protein, partial [Patescibacteria group bacterium]
LKPAAVFLLAIVLSALFAAHLKETVYFFLLNAVGLAVFFSIINLGLSGTNRIVALVKLAVVLGVFSAATAVWQLYSSSFKFLYYPFVVERDQLILEKWEEVSRVVGVWQHPSYLGIYLAILIPLSAFLIFYGSSRLPVRIFWAGSLVFMTSVLLLTNTRSSALAGFLGMALMFFLANLFPFRFSIDVKKLAVLGTLAALSLVLYQFVFVSEIYTKPQAWRVDASATIWGRFLRADSMSTESLVQRSKLYELAWQTYLTRPFFGVGAKNFQYEVEKTFGTGTDGHNLVLQTAAEMGTVGIFSIFWLYGAILLALFRSLKNIQNPDQKYLLAALFGTVFLILFDSMFNNPLYSLRIAAVFWIIVALQYSMFLDNRFNA